MTRLKHVAEINKPLKDVYVLAKQVDRYPQFLPVYLESRILERHHGRLLLERKAVVRGELHMWQSWVRFEDLVGIDFEHAAGPLKGMKVRWCFEALSPKHTRLTITHDIRVRRPFLVGWFKEKLLFAPRVSEMADRVINGFKQACESN
jgi:ribosome-associated toxin RatA of RatAB toxin-antitoxin module